MSETERREPAADGRRTGEREDAGVQEPSALYAWIASLSTVLLLVIVLLLERGQNSLLRMAGAAVLILSAAFIFAPFFQLPRHGGGQEGQSYMQTGAVVERGLYAIVRHPQYLGYMLLACGFALLSQHWLALSLAAMGVAAFYLQTLEEERYCLARFGAAYERYRQRVPRFNLVLGLARWLRQGRG